MRRFATILLVLTFMTLGAGVMESLHNHVHAIEDAAVDVAAHAAGLPDKQHPVHDESNCEFHAQLHVPLLVTAWVPLLILLGLFVAFLTLLASSPISHRFFLLIDCRGPPVCW